MSDASESLQFRRVKAEKARVVCGLNHQRILQIAATTALLCTSLSVIQGAPASAAGPGCNGDADENKNGTAIIIGGSCGGSGGGLHLDPNWETIKHFTNIPCVDSRGNISWAGVIRNRTTGETQGDVDAGQAQYCLVAHTNDVGGKAKKALKSPKLEADFTGDFLTGAPIAFKSNDIRSQTIDIPDSGGAYFTATALDVTWDFDDGTKSTDLEPVHTYETIAPTKDNKDLHSVHVTATGNWHVYFFTPFDNQMVDFGVLSATGYLDRSIVQVWSQQTEPN